MPGGHTDTRIPHGKFQCGGALLVDFPYLTNSEIDTPIFRRKLYSVGKQIRKHLQQALTV